MRFRFVKRPAGNLVTTVIVSTVIVTTTAICDDVPTCYNTSQEGCPTATCLQAGYPFDQCTPPGLTQPKFPDAYSQQGFGVNDCYPGPGPCQTKVLPECRWRYFRSYDDGGSFCDAEICEPDDFGDIHCE